jgi:hypothetical protein
MALRSGFVLVTIWLMLNTADAQQPNSNDQVLFWGLRPLVPPLLLLGPPFFIILFGSTTL